MSVSILLQDLNATERLGEVFAASINDYALVALEGNLGAGKTTLVKCIGAGLGVREVISSPTFTMLNEYHSGRLPLFHLDIYRGGETGETMDLETLGIELEELLAPDGDDCTGVALIEWPRYFVVGGRSFFEGRDYLTLDLRMRPAGYEGNDNHGYTTVLQSEEAAEKYIKDGFTHSRIATLSANGPRSVDLLAALSRELSAMVINL